MTGHAFALIKLMRFGSHGGRRYNRFFIQIAVRASQDFQLLNLCRVCLAVRIRLPTRAQRTIRTGCGGIRMGAFVFIAALLAYILAVIAMRRIPFIAIYIGLPQFSAVVALPHQIPVFRNAVRFSIIVCNSVIVLREPFMLFNMLMRTGIFQTAIQAFSIAENMLRTRYCCRFRRRLFRRLRCRVCVRLLICLAARAVCSNFLRNRIGLRQGRYMAHQQSHAHQHTSPFLKAFPSSHVFNPPRYD